MNAQRPLQSVSLSLLVLAFLVPPPCSSQTSFAVRDKIDPWVRERLVVEGRADVLIFLAEQADLREAEKLRGRSRRGAFVYERLRSTARRTQGGVLAELTALGLSPRPFWIANMIQTHLDPLSAEILAARSDVARIVANPEVRNDLPALESSFGACPPTVEPSLLQIDADAFWNAGFEGRGVVIGGQDTGYDWDHPALKDAYRGWDGVSASHDYHWHDSIHSGGGVCGADAPQPCDDFGHGTHTLGTMVGDTVGVRVGVAPGARWIGCRNMDQGNGTPATYSECFEWFVAPTRVDGSDPDPSQAPHVINNSWGCPPSEGCTDPNVMRTVVENTRAAGILVVSSAGNSGSGCGSVSTPAAIYEATLTVGSVDGGDNIAGSSSRGPVSVDGSNRIKPDLSAPGVGICSSTLGTGYGTSSGTSMAAPHVAGMAALLISAAPCLEGDVDALEAHLTSHALARTGGQTCGGIPGLRSSQQHLRARLAARCAPGGVRAGLRRRF